MKHPLILSGIVLGTVVVTSFVESTKASSAATAQSTRSESERRPSAERGTQLGHVFPEVDRPTPVAEPARHWERDLRPFPVAIENAGFQWTEEDGMKPEVIAQLANNSTMVAALEEENEEILRRQLLYVPSNFAEKAASIYRGEESKVTLPGLDGEVFRVELTHNIPLNPAKISGSFAGKIAGVADSEVVAASENNSWSIGITTPELSLQITTREVGEWIIVQRDPNYVSSNTECGCCENGEHQAGKPLIPSHSVDNVGIPFGF